MTNDYKQGWRKKLAWDANQRKRRTPAIRRRVERFRRANSKAKRCTFKGKHRGALQVHHVGGLGSTRLAWACEHHNQRAAGNRVKDWTRPKKKGRSRRTRRPRSLWDALFG